MAVLANQLTVLGSEVSREDVETIKRAVAPTATDVELKQFLHLSVKYGLDPMAKEIYFAKFGGRPTILVGRDGYMKIAMADPNFDGMQSMVVKEGDHFEIDVEHFKVIHRMGAKRGEILGAWAIARHKRRAPVICFVDFKEYRQNTDVWAKYPSAMIQKVAEVFVLRRQFNISGLVSHEEIGMPEEARFGGGPAIDITPGQQPEEEQPQPQRPPSPTGHSPTDTLRDMQATNEGLADRLKREGMLNDPPPAAESSAAPDGKQGVPGEEIFPTSPEPVAPTPAQVAALNKAWDALGVAKQRREEFLGGKRPWAKWEGAIATLEAEVAKRLAEKVRGETMKDILQIAQVKEISAPGIAKALWPGEFKGDLRELSDRQLAELLRKVKEA